MSAWSRFRAFCRASALLAVYRPALWAEKLAVILVNDSPGAIRVEPFGRGEDKLLPLPLPFPFPFPISVSGWVPDDWDGWTQRSGSITDIGVFPPKGVVLFRNAILGIHLDSDQIPRGGVSARFKVLQLQEQDLACSLLLNARIGADRDWTISFESLRLPESDLSAVLVANRDLLVDLPGSLKEGKSVIYFFRGFNASAQNTPRVHEVDRVVQLESGTECPCGCGIQ